MVCNCISQESNLSCKWFLRGNKNKQNSDSHTTTPAPIPPKFEISWTSVDLNSLLSKALFKIIQSSYLELDFGHLLKLFKPQSYHR